MKRGDGSEKEGRGNINVERVCMVYEKIVKDTLCDHAFLLIFMAYLIVLVDFLSIYYMLGRRRQYACICEFLLIAYGKVSFLNT